MKHRYAYLTLFLTFFSNFMLHAQDETPNSPIAEGKDKWLGNIHATSQLPDFTQYWNQVTPENAGKWGSVERNRDEMNWNELDAAYALARDNGYPFRFHVLVWGNQQPGWIEDLEPEEQLEEIEEWFAAVAERYPDIDYLEVVNEPINDPPRRRNSGDSGSGNYIAALGGTGATGWDWVINSFRMAREHFPNAALMINEYNIVGDASNTRRYIGLIEHLQAEELIDVIGVQAHAFSTRDATTSAITSNLNRLADTGLPLMVTELDIDGPTDAVQLQEYQRVFPLFWEHPAIVGVTLWGWKPGMWRTEQEAFLVNRDGTDRPAFTWLQDYVSGYVTGIDNSAFEGISIYPNPATNGRLRITGDARLSQLKILDMRGNMLQEIDMSGSNELAAQSFVEIELKASPGVYLVQLTDGQNTSFKKIIVQ